MEDESIDRAWSTVREAQRQAALKLARVFVVPAIDLSLSDTTHNSSAGNMILGERMAKVALGGVYKKSVEFKAPDITRAVKSDDGKTVKLVFDNVTGRLWTADSNTRCFKVEDENGDVAINEIEYGDKEIYLKLSRRLVGSAVAHGAYGANPSKVPVDIDRMMPILAFYNVEIK